MGSAVLILQDKSDTEPVDSKKNVDRSSLKRITAILERSAIDLTLRSPMVVLLSRWILLVILLCLSISEGFSDTTSLRCSEVPVAFAYDDPHELKCLCSTSKAAIAFLKTIGLQTTDCITIRIVKEFQGQQAHTLFGLYNTTSLEVSIVTYSKAEVLSQGGQVFGIDLTEDLWCSFAAHELAHAISEKFLNPKIKAHTAGEYISSIVQLAVLTPSTRENILERYKDVKAYQSREEMSELYYLLDPNRFAVKCYRHFIALKDPRDFIDRLIHEGNGF